MGLSVFPISGGGGIKSVQRGQAVSAGSITITSVNISKSFVRSFPEGSAGTVAVTGDTTGTYSPSGGSLKSVSGSAQNSTTGSFSSYSGTRSFSGGTTSLTTAVYGAYLSNPTSLAVSGACRWEVVEFA
jgi:hypothetical protein